MDGIRALSTTRDKREVVLCEDLDLFKYFDFCV